jgi:hypothetical protein
MIWRRITSLSLSTLVMSLILLYTALAGVQSSTAEMMPEVMRLEASESASQAEIAAAGQVLHERLSAHLSEDARLSLAPEGRQLLVSLPDSLEPSVVLAEASRIGRVELVDGGTQFLPIHRTVKTGPQPIPNQDVYQAVLTALDFEAAEARLNEHGRPVIHFTLNPPGDARLAAHTSEMRGYYLCLVIDGRVVNCPVLRTPLQDRRGTIELTGEATLDDAQVLARLVRSGPLPIRLRLSRH